jgi:DDE superfamily endonuclease
MVLHEPSAPETTPVDLPPEMVAVLAAFAPLFSDRVWIKAQALTIGAILATGRRTVCSVLRILGLGQERHFTNYHRVLNRDAWSCLAAGQILLGLIIALIPRDWPIALAVDDTIERRGGRRIKAKGCYRDAVRSSKKHLVKCFGLRWIALMILVPVPWSQRVWALPVLTTLSWPEGAGRRRGHKTSIACARQLVLQVRRWLPERELILVADGG